MARVKRFHQWICPHGFEWDYIWIYNDKETGYDRRCRKCGKHETLYRDPVHEWDIPSIPDGISIEWKLMDAIKSDNHSLFVIALALFIIITVLVVMVKR